MTEPVAYLVSQEPLSAVRWLSDVKPIGIDDKQITPLYTEEQLHPHVKMTKEQYEILVLSRNNAVNRVDKVGLLEFMSAYSLLNQEIDHLSLMQAWLHPENIKVVDE